MMSWVVPFSFDTVLSLLSIVRAIRVSRKLKTPLTTQLIRDGERKHHYVTMSMSDHIAGFGYYGLAFAAPTVLCSLTASQDDDCLIRHVSINIRGVFLCQF